MWSPHRTARRPGRASPGIALLAIGVLLVHVLALGLCCRHPAAAGVLICTSDGSRLVELPGDAPPPSSVDCDACTAACGAAGALPPRELPAVAAAGPPAAPLPAAAAALRHGSAAGFHSRAPPVPA